MERLTKKDSQGYYIDDISVPYDEKRRGPAVDRLGAYEDKGVAPEDALSALEMAKAACKLAVADAYTATGLMPERVAELAKAEKDGRLVVLPEGMVAMMMTHLVYQGNGMDVPTIEARGDERYLPGMMSLTVDAVAKHLQSDRRTLLTFLLENTLNTKEE